MENKYVIEMNESQVTLINKALDFYSRIGILQLDEILSHSSIKKMMMEMYRPKDELCVGSNTERGEVIEIGEDYIDTKGSWGNGEEIKRWYDIENVKLSIDWSRYHNRKDALKSHLSSFKQLMTNGEMVDQYYGIHSDEVDDSCRACFDIQQQLRHELWKNSENSSIWTVDSTVLLCDSKNNIKIKKVENGK